MSTTLPKPSDLSAFRRAALQGDLRTGLQELRAIDPGALTDKDRATRECVLQRFDSGAPVALPAPLPAAAQAILAAYRRYWTDVMLRRETGAEGEAILFRELAEIVPANDSADRSNIDALAEETKRYLDAMGLHSLTGMTRPLYELMLWRKESEYRYQVRLPERSVDVTVVFMEDFVTRGWSSYATCDRIGTGGWASADRLFAVSESYDRSSETFRVSYLAHEGQHFADYPIFPKLEQPELEYRAKLTELAVSTTTTRKLLLAFVRGAQRGRTVPHAHAEYWLALALSRRLLGTPGIETSESRWASVDDAKVRDEAVRLLLESSDTLNRLGAATATQFLPD